jgi:hypothetical protein
VCIYIYILCVYVCVCVCVCWPHAASPSVHMPWPSSPQQPLCRGPQNPLYKASLRVPFIAQASIKGHDTSWHVRTYCHERFPFVHLCKAPRPDDLGDWDMVADLLREVCCVDERQMLHSTGTPAASDLCVTRRRRSGQC